MAASKDLLSPPARHVSRSVVSANELENNLKGGRDLRLH